MIKRISTILIFVPFVLMSCATLNESECQVADWHTLGNTDGVNGHASTYISNHVKACSKFGIAPDQSAWRSGWDVGIRTHCTASNGLSRGKQGRYNANACPVDLAASYNEGHRLGKAVYDARKSRNSLKSEIDSEIVALSKATPEEIAAKQVQIELKRNRLFDLQNELNRAERRADQFQFNGVSQF